MEPRLRSCLDTSILVSFFSRNFFKRFVLGGTRSPKSAKIKYERTFLSSFHAGASGSATFTNTGFLYQPIIEIKVNTKSLSFLGYLSFYIYIYIYFFCAY